MKGFSINLEQATKENTDFRRVLYTAQHSQLVLMSIQPGEDIGNEVHQDVDQFIRIEAGTAKGILNNGETEYELADGSCIIVPAGAWHNIVNTGSEVLKLYTVYSPPEHRDQVTEATKADEVEEHFDGKTTE